MPDANLEPMAAEAVRSQAGEGVEVLPPVPVSEEALEIANQTFAELAKQKTQPKVAPEPARRSPPCR